VYIIVLCVVSLIGNGQRVRKWAGRADCKAVEKLSKSLEARIEELLRQVRDGKLTPRKAARAMVSVPFEAVGIAHIDHHRSLRQGIPEAILCTGKKLEHVVQIADRIAAAGSVALATRVPQEWSETLKQKLRGGKWFPEARIFALYPKGHRAPRGRARLAVASAGTADLPVAEEAAVTAESHGVKVARLYDVGVAGLHRLLASADVVRDAEVVIVVAGMDGALPSVVGGLVAGPVIAVPTSIGYGANFDGLAPLLTMLNSCAPGVVTVNIDNGYGAAVAACKMLRKR